MRLWSINPCYLDAKGLVSCWRETLLGQSVLKKGKQSYSNKYGYHTTPYYFHPQLERFKKCEYPLRALGQYLTELYEEGKKRGYKFDASKIEHFYCFSVDNLTVTQGQLEYEFLHLQRKLWYRDKQQRIKNESVEWVREGDLLIHNIKPNPIFQVVDGQIESWEKIK